MEKFCQAYAKDPMNQKQCAIDAGYSEKTAAQKAHTLLKDPRIQERIGQLMAARNKRLNITLDSVMADAEEIKNRCMQRVKPVLDMQGEHVEEDGKLMYTFDAKNAIAALAFIAKLGGLGGFKPAPAARAEKLIGQKNDQTIRVINSPDFKSKDEEDSENG